MNSLISRYSIEGNTNGEPNGHFYLDRAGANSVAREVVNSHLGFHGAKAEAYLKENVPKFWNHYDVLGEGFIDVEKGTSFLRSLLGEVELNNVL